MNADHRVPEEIAVRLVSPDAHAERRALLADLESLRSGNPVGLVSLEGYDPFWLVTRHDDVLRVTRETDLFVSSARPSNIVTKAGEAYMRQRSGGPWFVQLLIHMDGAQHADHRRLLQNWFTASRLAALEDTIAIEADKALDHVSQRGGQCDFVNDVALRFTARVLMKVIGMPEEDEDFLLEVTQRMFNRDNRDEGGSGVPKRQAGETTARFLSYVGKLTEQRARQPADDLASAIAGGRIAGAPIDPMQAAALYLIVLTAGHDTTSSSLAGAIWGLSEAQDELRKVQTRPSLIAGLIEEAVRWTSPVVHFMRTAARTDELGGHVIRAGDWLMLSYLSANNDDAVFQNPDRFLVERDRTSKVAFGAGAHACLGQHLAKLEMRIFFQKLLPRLSSIELAGEPKRSKSLSIGGPCSVPVKLGWH